MGIEEINQEDQELGKLPDREEDSQQEADRKQSELDAARAEHLRRTGDTTKRGVTSVEDTEDQLKEAGGPADPVD